MDLAKQEMVRQGTKRLLFPDKKSFSDLLETKGTTFCSVQRADTRYVLWVNPTPLVSARIKPLDSRDRVTFQIIEWKDTGLALVVAAHSLALIDEWMSFIDVATIPKKEEDAQK